MKFLLLLKEPHPALPFEKGEGLGGVCLNRDCFSMNKSVIFFEIFLKKSFWTGVTKLQNVSLLFFNEYLFNFSSIFCIQYKVRPS